MECKFFCSTYFFSCLFELIDTLWNVNCSSARNTYFYAIELIDTLWNVNKGECEIPLIYDRELIDTLWNVNDI